MKRHPSFICFLSAVFFAGMSIVSCGEKPKLPPEPENPGEEPSGPTVTETAVTASPAAFDGEKRASVTYQLLVYSFADSDGDGWGDFNGITERLGYLDDMGVSAIWLSPIHPSSSYHGYSVSDYFTVNDRFGTEADFSNLVSAAHEKGISIYLDYVLNHSGSDNPWFIDAVSSADSRYRDWYLISDDPENDVRKGMFPMLGTGGYNAGEWHGAPVNGRMHFLLDWRNPSAPTVTVSRTDEDPDVPDEDGTENFFIWYGEGRIARFKETSAGIYELTLDFDSSWGFLIRTSDTTWDGGTKWGAASATAAISFDVPFALDNKTAADIHWSLLYQGVFDRSMPDFNYGDVAEAENTDVFRELVSSAGKWISLGVDGFRLDAVKHIYPRADGPENPLFLSKWYDAVNELYHAAGHDDDIYMVGEVLDGEVSHVAPYYRGLPALFEFAFWYRLEWAINNYTGCYFVKDILGYQDQYKANRADYIEPTKLSNHDEDRAGELLGRSLVKEKLAACVLLTAGGEPYVYQGEELGYYGSKAGGDEYVRAPMKWTRSGTVPTECLGGKVDANMLNADRSVEAQLADEGSLLNVYRTFMRLRNTYPALADGVMSRHVRYNDSNTADKAAAVWYMTARDGSGRMLVTHNFGNAPITLDLAGDDLSHCVGLNGDVSIRSDGGAETLVLGSFATAVFEQ